MNKTRRIHFVTILILIGLVLNINTTWAIDNEVNSLSVENDFDPKTTQELRIRLGLPNFFSKVNNQDTIRVGYIGGSITAGEGKWSEKTFNWLQNQYPQSHFEIINIAVAGTGTALGAFRIGTEMLVHKPDLVFIEYRVNGLGGQGMKGPEGMIRQIYRSNPKTDICIVYTISQGMISNIRDGKQTSVGEVMEIAANHYGIPSIDMGIEVVKLLDEEKLVFKNVEPIDGKIVFSKDGTHPQAAGIEIYTEVVTRNLQKMLDSNTPFMHALPAPIEKENFEYPTIHTVDKLSVNSNWESVDHDKDPIFKTGKWRSSHVLNKTIKCSKVEEAFLFNWEGYGLCLTTIPQGDGMTIEVSTDGSTAKEYVLKQNGSDRYGSVMLYLPFLKDGRHKTMIKITKLPNASSFYFGQYYTVRSSTESSTVIKKIDAKASLKIYPNPAHDYLNIPTFLNKITYIVFDVNGQRVLEGISENNSINTSRLGKGLYFIQIENNVAKFIKG